MRGRKDGDATRTELGSRLPGQREGGVDPIGMTGAVYHRLVVVIKHQRRGATIVDLIGFQVLATGDELSGAC